MAAQLTRNKPYCQFHHIVVKMSITAFILKSISIPFFCKYSLIIALCLHFTCYGRVIDVFLASLDLALGHECLECL